MTAQRGNDDARRRGNDDAAASEPHCKCYPKCYPRAALREDDDDGTTSNISVATFRWKHFSGNISMETFRLYIMPDAAFRTAANF